MQKQHTHLKLLFGIHYLCFGEEGSLDRHLNFEIAELKLIRAPTGTSRSGAMSEGESGTGISVFSDEERIRLEAEETDRIFQQNILMLMAYGKHWGPYQYRRKRIAAPHAYDTPATVTIMRTNIEELKFRCGIQFPAALGLTWEQFFSFHKIPLPKDVERVETIRVGNISDGQYKTKLRQTILEHVNLYKRANLGDLKVQVCYWDPSQLEHERIVEGLDRQRQRLLEGDPDVNNRVDRSTSITPGRVSMHVFHTKRLTGGRAGTGRAERINSVPFNQVNLSSSVEDGRQGHHERNSVNDGGIGMDLSTRASPATPPVTFRDRGERSAAETADSLPAHQSILPQPLNLSNVSIFSGLKGGRN